MKDNIKNIITYKVTSTGIKITYSCKDHSIPRTKTIKYDKITKKDQNKIKSEATKYHDILVLLQQKYVY